MSSAKLSLNDREYELPVIVGAEDEIGLDISALRSSSKSITVDPGYGNTGSCLSKITFVDGERGILRYRMNLQHPEQIRKPGNKKRVNHYLRRPHGATPAQTTAELFAGYGTVIRDAAAITTEMRVASR